MSTLAAIRAVAPRLPEQRAQAYANALDRAYAARGVPADGPARPLIVAQLAHECAGFTATAENMRYSAARIRQVWPSRPEAVQFAGNPEGLASSVYANRMGNGPPSTRDGWLFRGSGWLHHTGRAEFARVQRATGAKVVSDPDRLRNGAEATLLSDAAVSYIVERKGALEAARSGDVAALTRAINGGTIGLADRKVLSRRAVAAYRDALDIEPGSTTAERAASDRRASTGTAGAGVTGAIATVGVAPQTTETGWTPWVLGAGVLLVAALAAALLWRRAARSETAIAQDRAQTAIARETEAQNGS